MPATRRTYVHIKLVMRLRFEPLLRKPCQRARGLHETPPLLLWCSLAVFASQTHTNQTQTHGSFCDCLQPYASLAAAHVSSKPVHNALQLSARGSIRIVCQPPLHHIIQQHSSARSDCLACADQVQTHLQKQPWPSRDSSSSTSTPAAGSRRCTWSDKGRPSRKPMKTRAPRLMERPSNCWARRGKYGKR